MNEVIAATRTPLRRLRWFQWSLRGFLLAMLAFCVWLGFTVHRARQQEAIVQRILANSRNGVFYAHELDAQGKRIKSPLPHGP